MSKICKRTYDLKIKLIFTAFLQLGVLLITLLFSLLNRIMRNNKNSYFKEMLSDKNVIV